MRLHVPLRWVGAGLPVLAAVALISAAPSALRGQRGQDPESGDAVGQTLAVWVSAQRVFEQPKSFARHRTVGKGTELELLGRSGSWQQVAWNDGGDRREGWTVFPPRGRRAGEAVAISGSDDPGVAFVLKGLRESLERMKTDTRLEALAAAHEDAWVDEADLTAFAKEGGLSWPGGAR